jgi:hypothetical protein
MKMNQAAPKSDKAISKALRLAKQVKAPEPVTPIGEATKLHTGAIKAPVAGRTDHLPMHVPSGSYVIPADIVSAIGEGNTAHGFDIVDYMVKQRMASGGDVNEMGSGDPVAIVAAGGEYVIPPEAVVGFGGGDMDAGHKALDEWVKFERANTIKTLQKLPPPKKD